MGITEHLINKINLGNKKYSEQPKKKSNSEFFNS